MPTLPDWVLRRETFAAVIVVALAAAIAAALYFSQATTLTIAVAPRDGTEPALIRAYADALKEDSANIRLKILSFDDVRESAAALQDGRADLAVVRPDVLLPKNGLTLAILRDQAMLIVSPEGSGITSFPKLAGRRLGIAAHRSADFWLLKNILAYYALTLEGPDGTAAAAPVPGSTVRLVAIEGEEAAAAIRDKRIDAFVSIIAASAPKARQLVESVRGIGRTGKVDLVDVQDSDAVIERFPRLQAVTVPAGLFGGRPKLPAEDVKTVGASYRLMARTSLSRAVAADVTQHLFEMRTAAAEQTDAAEYVQAPAYETTVAATSARIPIHPGAIDYFEREQHGFVERYGDTLYLLAALAGGLASAAAWLRQRLASLRRERIDEVTDRLLEITDQARSLRDPDAIAALAVEIDKLAIEVVRDIRRRELDSRTMAAVSIAIETARATVADCRAAAGEKEGAAAPVA
ncbi:TAXI family TRAP transporter solute-binding subunit [Methylobacterium sp. 17Sr1-1]|uniref:TAXI family TRAP transporter solute-binding subunit n=1 Tax=Methylobacterium sp. 17Sr1-1 TaxID=2202826 RepID=UPI000D7020DF|nr:TAXI family TRAP transporter solute-binding subunit [Methylobacterium sp. 17Sr1-1]AWN52146.1 C4-dicarboxylate ABC transporter substrate-binding protein [Methylobacterium sp. 17Sr1-1]